MLRLNISVTWYFREKVLGNFNLYLHWGKWMHRVWPWICTIERYEEKQAECLFGKQKRVFLHLFSEKSDNTSHPLKIMQHGRFYLSFRYLKFLVIHHYYLRIWLSDRKVVTKREIPLCLNSYFCLSTLF